MDPLGPNTYACFWTCSRCKTTFTFTVQARPGDPANPLRAFIERRETRRRHEEACRV